MKRIKWFLGEFLVVVCGVLVAFILNSWWLDIKEGQKEKQYLNQIEGEIGETIKLIRDAKNFEIDRCKSLALLVRAVYSNTLPPDSVLSQSAISGMGFNPGEQVSATLSSLVETGDLQIIKNDSLRSALVIAIDKLKKYDKDSGTNSFQWLISTYEGFANEIGLFNLVLSKIDSSEIGKVAGDSLSIIPAPDLFQRPDSIDWHELLKRKSFQNSLENLFVSHSNLRRLHSNAEEAMLKFQASFLRMREN